MKRSLSLILALLLLLPVAFAEKTDEFTLRDSITWSSTPEEVTEAVGKKPISQSADRCSYYSYFLVPFGKCSGTMQAVFSGKENAQLVALCYMLTQPPRKQTEDQAVADLKAALDMLYTPAECDLAVVTDTFNLLCQAIGEPVLEESDFSGGSCKWTAFEDTDILLTKVNGTWTIVYFNRIGIDEVLSSQVSTFGL